MQPADNESGNAPTGQRKAIQQSGNLSEALSPSDENKKPGLQLDAEDLQEIKLTNEEVEDVLNVKLDEDAAKGPLGPEEKDIND